MSVRGTLALVSALLCAAVVLRLQSSTSTPHQATAKQRGVREEFIPSQTLELTNGENQLLEVTVFDEGIGMKSVWDGGAWFFMHVYRDSGKASVRVYGKNYANDVLVTAGDDGYMVAGEYNPIFGTWTQLLKPSLFTRLMSPSKSSPKGFDDLIPTEDLRLRDRNGWAFASMGLTASGDPGMAFADAKGVVRGAWVQRRSIVQPGPDWWEVSSFDKTGHLRVSLELRPGQHPDLALFADDIGGQYYADFPSRKLTPVNDISQSELPSLSAVQVHPARPIQLLDNRHRKLWSAP